MFTIFLGLPAGHAVSAKSSVLTGSSPGSSFSARGPAALDCPFLLSDGDFLILAWGSENRKFVLHGKRPKLATRSSSLPGHSREGREMEFALKD